MENSSNTTNADFLGKFKKEWEQIQKEIKKVSILVMGGSGTGKSTLVNCVFKKEIATAGAGRPITHGIDLYENDYLRIYDSEGYESGEANQERYNKLITDFLDEKAASVETDVHLTWYCVSTPSARFTDLDAELIKRMTQNHKKALAVVLTKIDIATKEQLTALTAAVENLCPDVPVFVSSTEEIPMENDLDALEAWSRARLDEARRKSFVCVSNRNLAAKESEGETIIRYHTASAFGVGFFPVPFSDAPILIANQMGLLARLSALWDMESLGTPLFASFPLDLCLSQLGKSLATGLLKCIPGLGTIVGGMINGSTAAALTYALGTATNKLFRKIQEDQLAGKILPFSHYINEDFFTVINVMFNQYRKENGGAEK